MSTRKYDPDIHRRRSIRLPSLDYASPGVYYVTICTGDRYPFFEHAELRAILERTCRGLALSLVTHTPPPPLAPHANDRVR